MQISPSTSLLHALSRPADPATAPRPNAGNADAARAAARAVFAQIKAPSAAAPGLIQGFSGPQQAPSPQQAGAPAQLPAIPPTKPMPRGSFLNILV